MARSTREVCQSVFGFSEFLGKQEQVIEIVLAGRSALAVFPTGGGKSLCFQLPGVMQEGLTLVVSPLIALMKDQIDFLQAHHVAAARYDSSLTPVQLDEVKDAMKSGTLKLLYISPERLSNERFVQSLQSVQIDLMVVDEAHCISEWGHNFRPDYLKLVKAAQRVGTQKILALTATATPAVVRDICSVFQIAEGDYVHDSFHRPNLEMHISPVPGVERDRLLLSRMKVRSVGSTIVYVTLQKTAETVAALLEQHGHPARAYHAGMDAEERNAVQDWFMASKEAAVVATIAFGMGIDKADIRYVYHYNCPKSIENYAQETGRAGRDGQLSVCEWLAVPEDRIALENFVYGDTPIDEAVSGVIQEVLAHDGEFTLSHYHLAREHDIRTLVLATLMTWLELDGVIESIGAIPGVYRFKALRSSQEIFADFDPARAAFLRSVFSQAKKGTIWLTLDLSKAAATIGEPMGRIAKALNYLEEKGDLELKVSQMMQRYRMNNHPQQPEHLIQRFVQRFEQREKSAIERLHQMLELADHASCRVEELLRYFGETLPGGHCGHCDICLDATPRPLPALEIENLSPQQIGCITTTAGYGHEALAHPRQLARFLCGISSPATQRDKLTQEQTFGALAEVPFSRVLAECKQMAEKFSAAQN